MVQSLLYPLRFFRGALVSPPRVGRQGARSRYVRLQAFLIIWRLLTLAQIPVLLVICPDRFLSTAYALFVFSAALAYTLLFAWMAARRSGSDNFRLHAFDQVMAAGLLFLAHEATLVYILAFYTYATLFSGPDMTPAKILPPAAGMSLAFLAAASLTPNPFYTDSIMVSEFLVYWFWGFSILGVSKILNRASALELDACLEQQRQDYRRQLHDDLGNTLCGLHFRIQSLKRAGGDDFRRTMAFLSEGYNRASDVLTRLLRDIDELEAQGFNEALAATIEKTKADFGIHVALSVTDKVIRLSPEVQREVLAIAREAIANAAKHAGAGLISVSVRRRRRRLILSIADGGKGLDTEKVRHRQEQGGSGLKGMRERAVLINGQLKIASGTDAGTTVTLKVPEERACRLARDGSTSADGVYTFFTFLKLLVSLLALVQLPLLEAPQRGNPLVWLIGGIFFIDGLAGFLWRHRAFTLIRRWPWLLVAEQAIFCILIYLSWRQQLFLVFEYSPSAALLVSACFLGTVRNIALAGLQGGGLALAYVLLSGAGITSGETTEELVTSITSNLLIALFAGLIVEFVNSLMRLQGETIERALARQREQLTSEAHRQLFSLIHNLGLEIHAGRETGQTTRTEDGRVGKIEASSRELKQALRRIMMAIDQQETVSQDPKVA